MAKQTSKQQPQVVIVKHDHGCLVSLLIVVLFGWLGVAWLACVWTAKTAGRVTRWTVRTAWDWLVAYPVTYTWRACLWAWRGAVALYETVQTRRQR